MADNVQDATSEILKGIQTSIADLRRDMTGRFEHLEDGIRKERRNSAGALVMMRATAGFFDERIRKLEDKVEAIQGQHG